jgi:hypothetical protein
MTHKDHLNSSGTLEWRKNQEISAKFFPIKSKTIVLFWAMDEEQHSSRLGTKLLEDQEPMLSKGKTIGTSIGKGMREMVPTFILHIYGDDA